MCVCNRGFVCAKSGYTAVRFPQTRRSNGAAIVALCNHPDRTLAYVVAAGVRPTLAAEGVLYYTVHST